MKSGFSFVAMIQLALTCLEQYLGRSTAFTPAVGLLLSGAKSRACTAAGPFRKTSLVLPEQLPAVLGKIFTPFDATAMADPVWHCSASGC
jgi:hypothetical protein